MSAYAYGLNPPDFHAYIECFRGGALGPVRPDSPCSTVELRRIGQGRDAADTSFATIFGGVVMNQMDLAMQLRTGRAILPSIPPLRFRIIRAGVQSKKESKSGPDRSEPRRLQSLYSAIVQKRPGCRGGYHR